jgi:ubiquinone/menaquinone biosynthesis C-methylase UbiE
MAFASGASLVLTGFLMIWGSKVGKLRVRRRVLDGLSLRGDERVLDVGCGRGLLLIGAAKRLTTGKAVGVDLWQTEDQSGNSPDTTLQNAVAEGVAARVEIVTGDARQLPFTSNLFDVVVSSWALHNIYASEERVRAIHEMTRVLKPGGRFAIVDIRHTDEYRRVLEESGCREVLCSGPSFAFLIPSYTLRGQKPEGVDEGSSRPANS